MTYARKTQVSLKDTPYYHVVARCVRRAWLYGYDEYAGKDYSHRKDWVIDRMRELALMFAIDVCAYAVMSNHYHLVLFIDALRAREWSDEEVIRRWGKLFRIPMLVQRYLSNETKSEAERDEARRVIRKWRKRLMDISWYMRCLNEHLARKANIEDDCKGRFWEGRFKSQALLDEAGLLTAMAYIDLNPIRAGIAATPEESEFTSIYQRIQQLDESRTTRKAPEDAPKRRVRLMRFQDQTMNANAIPFSLTDYFTLVDWTGRAIREGKRGSIDAQLPPILTRLNIDNEAWIEAMQPHGNVFGRAMGKLNHLYLHAKTLGQKWIKGLREAERLYRPA
jgi:REP element-mobilizing transposase RayT